MSVFEKLFRSSRKIVPLKDFVLTGHFGPVRVGMHKEKVIKLLGEADQDNDFGTGYGGLLYGWYEFFYSMETGIIDSIQHDHLSTWFQGRKKSIFFKNKIFKIDPWFLRKRKDITYKEVKQILIDEGIPFEEAAKYDTPLLTFASEVTMDFDDQSGVWQENRDGSWKEKKDIIIDNSDDYVLNGIRYFPTRK